MEGGGAGCTQNYLGASGKEVKCADLKEFCWEGKKSAMCTGNRKERDEISFAAFQAKYALLEKRRKEH